jgi:ATP-dependent DNA helicase RecG
MIRLKLFISSVQKELGEERSTLGGLLATDPFLSGCMVPRLFEEYPAPLRPNKQAYLDMLRTCHVYLLVVGKEYGNIVSDGLSATHQEYRLAQEMGLPTLVCVKGDGHFERDAKEQAFFDEVRSAGHTYSPLLCLRVLNRLKHRLLRLAETRQTRSRLSSRLQISNRRFSDGCWNLDRFKPPGAFRILGYPGILRGGY